MVRVPLSAEQIEAGRRLGALLRAARAECDPADLARAAGISPETLRKIETGRLPSPGFGTVVSLAEALDLPLADLAAAWRGEANTSGRTGSGRGAPSDMRGLPVRAAVGRARRPA